jgi:hypothetical protein
MTYCYTDEDGEPITVRRAHGGLPVVVIKTTDSGCYIPLDKVEELIAGIRDAARQAAGLREGAAT